MSNFTLTAVIPVLNRPKNVERFIKSFLDNTPLEKAELLFVTNESCKEEIDEIKKFGESANILLAPDDIISWGKRINYGVSFSEINTKFSTPSSWILCGADDVTFDSNWFFEAEKASLNFDGIIGTNDLGHPATTATVGGWHTTHPIVSRKYIMEQGIVDEKGKFCHEGYHHNYVDVEFVHTSMRRNCWKHVPTCIIEHHHPAWNKAISDDVYAKGQENVSADQRLWAKRSAQFKLQG